MRRQVNEDLEEDVRAIRDKWFDAADEVDMLEVGLDADDIEITDTRLIWLRQ